MSVFERYARYYGLLYRDKDYAGEAAYVAGLLRQHGAAVTQVLDVGCGNGRHATELVRRGFVVHGVDRSAEMLAAAEAAREALPAELASRLAFSLGDATALDLGRRFDAVVALFHVLSYQNENAQVLAMLRGAAAHLAPGGLFLFDCWYGPAVLAQRPEPRLKVLDGDGLTVYRLAEPALDSARNVVTVDYRILVRDRAAPGLDEIRESHPMRYFFLPEIRLLLELSGFRLELACEYLTGAELSDATWGACFLARRAVSDDA